MTYASSDDVAAAYDDELSGDLIPWIENRLELAELFITSYTGDLADRITAGLTTAEAIRAVEVEMVVRVLRNPSGYRMEASGPYSYTLDTALASGQMHLTRLDRRLLGLSGGAVTIPMQDSALPYVHVPPNRTWRWRSADLPLP